MYIDPHIHMVSRTTDDYQRMALAGCVAITEPAFWPGYDRSSPEGFQDYFRQLTDFEPKRAAQYGIRHHTWLCINPKEAEDPVGIGEIGLNKNSRNEMEILEAHLELAASRDLMVLVHTPHLEDKLKGTRLIMDAIKNQAKLDPSRVLIDHVEEHTVGIVLERGFWAGMTLYPDTKCTPQRAVDIFEMHGTERLWMNSAGDWGQSDPLAVPKAQLEMRARGHDEAAVRKVSFDNPLAFLSQSGRFKVS